MLPEQRPHPVALIEVEPAVKYSLVQKGIYTNEANRSIQSKIDPFA